ncbi:hypothetical protein [Verrucomicrobium spinosum]|uniref:hypothetical protein n=1 Tax=Verrucomicrobium spinosum TaxID=2736 RepID=UPI0001745DF2|nr:hypothetical protein [Verrucomicrobium spinosum]
MIEGIALIILVLFVILDGIMRIVSALYDAERWRAESSLIGEAPWDRDARSWTLRLLEIWHTSRWVLWGIAVIVSGGCWIFR